jgi:hypothetical protein
VCANDFWVSDDANSGIFIRLSDPNDPACRTGAIVDGAKPLAQIM